MHRRLGEHVLDQNRVVRHPQDGAGGETLRVGDVLDEGAAGVEEGLFDD